MYVSIQRGFPGTLIDFMLLGTGKEEKFWLRENNMNKINSVAQYNNTVCMYTQSINHERYFTIWETYPKKTNEKKSNLTNTPQN